MPDPSEMHDDDAYGVPAETTGSVCALAGDGRLG